MKLNYLFLFLLLGFASCSEKDAGPDYTTEVSGTYESYRAEILNLSTAYRAETFTNANITKVSNKEVKLTMHTKIVYFNRSGLEIQTLEKVEVIQNAKMKSLQSFEVDEIVEGSRITGTGVLSGRKIVMTLNIVDSDGEDYGGTVTLTKI